MKRVLVALALFTAVAVGGGYLALSLWAGSFPQNETFRLRATATIEVDGVQRTGSSVQEYRLQWNYQPQLGNHGAWRLVARGEGIKIDVPGEEPIFVQISADTVFGNCADRVGGNDELRLSLLNMSVCEVDVFPTAIRFTGEDHRTAEAVHSARADRNGYRFVRMVFERTDSPVTQGTIPTGLATDPKGLIRVPFDGLVKVMDRSDFSSESYR